MAIYDQLGPLARRAADESPRDLTLGKMLLAWRREVGIDDAALTLLELPRCHPRVDRAIADFITRAIKERGWS